MTQPSLDLAQPAPDLAPRPCTTCKGAGVRHTNAFTYEGRSYPATTRCCLSCGGTKAFLPPDIEKITAAITGRRGLRSKRPDDRRAYYVWRHVRFHAGHDVTLPVTAHTEISGDPFRDVLDTIARIYTQRVYGLDQSAGTQRWRSALGHSVEPLPNMPASAYPCGPVVLDGNKPIEEAAELT